MRLRTLGMVAAAVLALAAPAMAQQAATLPVTHTVTLTAVFVDAADYQTAAIPCAAVTWTSSDTNKAALTVGEAGGSALLTPLLPGPVTITATCGPLSQTLAVQILGPAVALRIGIGEPKPKGGV